MIQNRRACAPFRIHVEVERDLLAVARLIARRTDCASMATGDRM